MSLPHTPRATPAVVLLLLAACAPTRGGGGDGDGDGIDTDGPGPVTISTTASFGSLSASQASVSASLSGPASVAAACTRRDDPGEVHLLESDGTTSVDFHFAGLRADTDYDCSVVATSPSGPPSGVSFRTAGRATPVASADVTRDPGFDMTGAYTVMNVRSECDGEHTNAVAVLDPDGENRWSHDLPRGTNIGIEVLPDGKDRLLWGGGDDAAGAPTVIDTRGDVVWQLDAPGSEDVIYHHDTKRIPDGRVLSVEQSSPAGWDAFRLRLVDETGATSWSWDAQLGVDSGWLAPGDAKSPDPHHLNWADVVETDDGLVAFGSLCYAFQIVAIDVASSAPLWKFGFGGDFGLVDGSGQPIADDFPECQHGLQTDGRSLLVYDNGFNRGFTRVVEYILDPDAGTATKAWEWLDEGFFERYHGGVEWLTPDHERVLVAEGNNDCGETSDRHSQVVEVDRPSGAEVHRLILEDIGDWIYRAHRVDGCELFANVRYCDALADRLDELRPLLDL